LPPGFPWQKLKEQLADRQEIGKSLLSCGSCYRKIKRLQSNKAYEFMQIG
jgi:hypothetical protein